VRQSLLFLKMDIGCVAGFSGQLKHTELFYKFSSQITPGTIYHVDLSAAGQPVSKVHITTKVSQNISCDHCCGSGSARIRIARLDPDPHWEYGSGSPVTSVVDPDPHGSAFILLG
jgi:hypothetical protein